jgi:phage replication O-like protein O
LVGKATDLGDWTKKMANSFNLDRFTPLQKDVSRIIREGKLTRGQIQVVLAIAEKTWGFKKYDDWVSNSQLVELTGLSRRYIREIIAQLNEMGLIMHETVNNRYAKTQINVKCSLLEVGTDTPSSRSESAVK